MSAQASGFTSTLPAGLAGIVCASLGLWLGFPSDLPSLPLLCLLYPAGLALLSRHARSWRSALLWGWAAGIPGHFAPIADYTLLRAALDCADESGLPVRVGNLLSSDNFYNGGGDSNEPWKRMGVLAVEMEAAGLYMNAARLGKRALAICTISDHIYLPEILSAEERQTSFLGMMTLALDTAVRMSQL